MKGAQAALLPDGSRLHLHHGPIDLILEAFGAQHEVAAAYGQAVARFETILEELVSELALLRSPSDPAAPRPIGKVARAMAAAASAHLPRFVTPMAAVAGAVADEVLTAMVAQRDLARAYVNNGGDAAFHLTPGTEMDAVIAGTDTGAKIAFETPVRGMATSGWRGRSHSLGIADSVTVLARSAAQADVAATLIANSVDLPGHPAVERTPAVNLSPDSDLGERPVTTAVGTLRPDEVRTALASGLSQAKKMQRRGLIQSAVLFLSGEVLALDPPARSLAAPVEGEGAPRA